MERPQAEWLIEFLEKAGKLKSVPRHCITPEGVRETVAGHCWRVSLMAWLLKEELPDVDMEKVIHMCLLHDLGEAVTGDIPAFEKKEQDRSVERKAVDGLLSMLPGKTGEEAKVLFAEMNALETEEAKVYKALDKLEAVIAHNESNISTWLPLEYELQQTYAAESVRGFPILEEIQRLAVEKTLEKIAEEGYDKAFGARPLRRAIQSRIEDAFAEEYLMGNFKAGDKVSVGLKTNGFLFRVVK